MSTKTFDDWDEDEDGEDFDFVPEDNDDEGDDYVDDEDDEDDDPEDFPSVLQGEMFVDRSKGLCYEKDGSFCLVCITPISSLNFPLEAPVKESPLVFAGWVNKPNNWMEFEVRFSEEPISNDPLQIQLLESQEQKQSCIAQPVATKTDNAKASDDWMEKKSPANGNLKAPPTYSLKQTADTDGVGKCSAIDSSSKPAARVPVETKKGKVPSDAKEDGAKLTKQKNTVFVVSASEIGNDDTGGNKISFQGAYRCPSKASIERIHLICPIQILDKTSSSVAGGTAAVAAASTSKNLSKTGDDDSVDGHIGVEYQELIDLHDDTRLSTEELRKRYYGSGEMTDNKRLKGATDRIYQRKDFDDDDDDDAYGF